ncbi:UDP-N-acetylglucosamine diphosphorylase/glucosamine-1-phosphate N-acetyltransferase [Mariprofundus sp. EBB-1]|uniref:bifunctional UDP-N-acetylglucosamine diphosphorylase/glucosamine-1-phosphate N-acetyltransferase GlmU n=1 Tax=Mariprofundus sp. EBB-1 TaxID=2650971 RepID=UPI000EF277F0|nr:bifunctional UDP-N-acetylglucosamine diphosphorylase/glucosamine-1-phosphate N-acetyltransferase GlmU [Mariprofundus sp. EBB-1]RLL54075.1 UDP-N-acetylglucosamine diphosphorylase/glucosamine-1-phosphate N-acetyltransferase [Mariprofundus sp. EBB-1]
MTQFHYPDLQVCVLAAGKGKRMRSNLPKVLHKVLGRAMIDHVLHTVEALRPKSIAVVTGHASEKVREHVGQPVNLDWVIQDKQLGTGHAVQQCEKVIRDVRDVLIVCGDTPMLSAETLARLVDEHRASATDVTVLTAKPLNSFGYGRIVRDEKGNVTSIVEQKDATDDQRLIGEVSSGIYCVRHDVLFDLLHAIDNSNAQEEYYLPDIVPLALNAGQSVAAVAMDDSDEMVGVNDRVDLAHVEDLMQKRIIQDWQRRGVTIEKPDTVRIEASVSIGLDTTIQAGCYLIGATQIGDECKVGPNAVLVDARLDDRVNVYAFSHIHGAGVGSDTVVGPYARLRPGAALDEHVHIGNFVEIKQAVIGEGSKVNHLSYIGDSTIGSNCNIGAGTITCNYDGANKFETVIGDNVFVGSDTQLVAPVSVGDDATIGAGSTITRNVDAGGLTLSERTATQYFSDWKRPQKDKR